MQVIYLVYQILMKIWTEIGLFRNVTIVSSILFGIKVKSFSQKLMIQLGEKGKNINDDIKSLVKKGLNPRIQKSLDSLRITGNNAVHPGKINLVEEPDKVLQLFKILNFIAEKMITEPNEIDKFYDELPEKAKEAVEKRDKK